MNGNKGLTSMICVAALGLGLAACVAGGSGTSGMRNTVDPGLAESIARATALNVAIEAAKATGADGTFDDTAHMVAPTVAATHDGTAVTVSVTEGGMRQRRVRRRQLRRTGRWPGTHRRVDRGPVRARHGDRTPHGLYRRRPARGDGLHAAKPQPAERGERAARRRDSSEGGLAVEAAYWPLVRSTSLAAAPARGSVTHGATGTGANEGLSFIGVFAGAAGGYSCSGATCTVTLDDTGAATEMDAGTGASSPTEGAMVQVPDYDHLQFGWWLQEKEDGSRGFQTFAGGTGFTPGAGTVTAAMMGSATYRGAAAGVYASVDVAGGQVTAATEGEFTAEATLTAHFFGALDDGEISGEVDSFRNMSGDPMAGWRVMLRRVGVVRRPGFLRGPNRGNARRRNERQRQLGRACSTPSAATTEDPRPGHVTGRFDAHFLGTRVAGAFGASKCR